MIVANQKTLTETGTKGDSEKLLIVANQTPLTAAGTKKIEEHCQK